MKTSDVHRCACRLAEDCPDFRRAKMGLSPSAKPYLSTRLRRLAFEPLEDRRLLSVLGQDQVVELFSTSPALFVENQGQWADESVRYLHQGDGVNVAMTDTGPVFQLFQQEADSRVGRQSHQS